MIMHPGKTTFCHHKNRRTIDGAVVPAATTCQWTVKRAFLFFFLFLFYEMAREKSRRS